MKIPLSTQISYMERHRELVKTKPEAQAAVDITEGIILTLNAYKAFETEISQQAEERNTR